MRGRRGEIELLPTLYKRNSKGEIVNLDTAIPYTWNKLRSCGWKSLADLGVDYQDPGDGNPVLIEVYSDGANESEIVPVDVFVNRVL